VYWDYPNRAGGVQVGFGFSEVSLGTESRDLCCRRAHEIEGFNRSRNVGILSRKLQRNQSYKSSGRIAFCIPVGADPRESTRSEGGEAEDSPEEEN
jgi:hypothetical protein